MHKLLLIVMVGCGPSKPSHQPEAPSAPATGGQTDANARGSDGQQPGIGSSDDAAPMVLMMEPTGNLSEFDRPIVRRYMKRNAKKLQTCYENGRGDNKALSGTVTAKFTIDGNGTVTSSSATGIAKVDGCVAEVIKGIEFPKPKGGVAVDVIYPFTFRPI